MKTYLWKIRTVEEKLRKNWDDQVKLREQSKTDEVEEKRSFSPKFETRVQKIKADPQIIQNLIQDNKSCRINSST